LSGSKGQIQLKDIHPWFPQNTKSAPFEMIPDQLVNNFLVKAAFSRYPGHLIQCCCQADMGVKSAAGSGDQIYRDRECIAGVGGVERINPRFDCLN
jgi:hypothetical protein